MTKTAVLAGFLTLTISASIADRTLTSFEAPDIVQPRVRELVRVAEDAFSNGDFEKSMACAELVRLGRTLTYSVDVSNLPSDQQAIATQAVAHAVDGWTESLGDVTFRQTARNRAVIRIKFAPSVRDMGREVAGFAVWQRQVLDWGNGRYGSRLSGDITVRSTNLDGDPIGFDAMVHSAGHEIGHLLGLWDSPNLDDIMGPISLRQPVTKPSEREVRALQEARLAAASIGQAALFAKRFR